MARWDIAMPVWTDGYFLSWGNGEIGGREEGLNQKKIKGGGAAHKTAFGSEKMTRPPPKGWVVEFQVGRWHS